MSTITEPTPGSQNLAAIQQVAQDKEGVIGPLQSFSVNGANNDLVFTVGDSPADDQLVVLEVHTADPPAKAGYTLVCSGEMLVSNTPTKVDAFRKTN